MRIFIDTSAIEQMRQSGIRAAFTFDRRFAEQGFEVLPSG